MLRQAASDENPMTLWALGNGIRANKELAQDEVPRLLSKAFEQTKTPADHGSLPAKMFLANLYASGTGVAKNPEMAFTLTQEAAGYNYPLAVTTLALNYLNGTGTEGSRDKALEYFKKAVDIGVPGAELQLARAQRVQHYLVDTSQGCTKETDCDGDRICELGACVKRSNMDCHTIADCGQGKSCRSRKGGGSECR